MSKNKDITIHSSAAEYLTYIAATGDTPESYEMRYEDENIWLTQKMIAALYDMDVRTINDHIEKIYFDGELTKDSTIRKFRIVQQEGTRKVQREMLHYNLQMIIAVGFKVNNERAIHFRKWAGQIVKDHTIQGWTMDKERLIKGHMFTDEYFERQLQQIREIRLSERKFYQKITDIYATSIDYDKDAKTTKDFFAKVQNKMHFAVSGNTAAEIIYNRADSEKEHMGLTSWRDAPDGKILKSDVVIAKNYLSEKELFSLRRIVSAYLDLAENMAMDNIPMTMEDWSERLDRFLLAADRDILDNPGKISMEIATKHALTQFEKYRVIQDKLYKNDFDKLLEETGKLKEQNDG